MTIVGVVCIVVGLMLSFALAMGLRSILCVVLFLYHLGASFMYWRYSVLQPEDAMGYYNAAPGAFAQLEPGTAFVQWLTASIRLLTGASFLDMFLLFHIAGYVGVVVLYELCRRMLRREPEQPDEQPSYLLYLIAFLPGFHVWTSGIGKDALVFLGILTFMWGVSRPQVALGYLVAGLSLCFMIRPHIATLLAGSCGVALVLSSGVRLHWRLTISVGLLGAIVFTVPYLKDFLKLEDLSSTGVMDYMGKRQGQTLDGGSGVEISSYPFPLKVLTFLYRPLFFDANSILGIVVSVENLVYLVISLLYLPRALGVLINGENTFFLRFNLVYWIVGTSILANSTANLGLAIRQKLMVLPAFIMLALAGYVRERSRAQPAELAPAQ